MKNNIQISREDMLELTRRMTVKRNCFTRLAGAYFDADGYVDGTFNINFLKLSEKEKNKNLAIAKTIPFADTNIKLKYSAFADTEQKPGSIWQTLIALKECELKNDALLDIFYEFIGERYRPAEQYAVYLFYGNYDVPLKAEDKESLWESEEVYSFIICTICPYTGDYELKMPEWGFLFPAFSERSSDINGIAVYNEEAFCNLTNIQ